jgi:hypothetical protein
VSSNCPTSEGVTQAELVEWHVKIGDLVRGRRAAAVMTDNAVEILAGRGEIFGWAPKLAM